MTFLFKLNYFFCHLCGCCVICKNKKIVCNVLFELGIFVEIENKFLNDDFTIISRGVNVFSSTCE